MYKYWWTNITLNNDLMLHLIYIHRELKHSANARNAKIKYKTMDNSNYNV